MPFCEGASKSFLSPISGALPVSPSIVAFSSPVKRLKKSFMVFIVFVFL